MVGVGALNGGAGPALLEVISVDAENDLHAREPLLLDALVGDGVDKSLAHGDESHLVKLLGHPAQGQRLPGVREHIVAVKRVGLAPILFESAAHKNVVSDRADSKS